MGCTAAGAPMPGGATTSGSFALLAGTLDAGTLEVGAVGGLASRAPLLGLGARADLIHACGLTANDSAGCGILRTGATGAAGIGGLLSRCLLGFPVWTLAAEVTVLTAFIALAGLSRTTLSALPRGGGWLCVCFAGSKGVAAWLLLGARAFGDSWTSVAVCSSPWGKGGVRRSFPGRRGGTGRLVCGSCLALHQVSDG